MSLAPPMLLFAHSEVPGSLWRRSVFVHPADEAGGDSSEGQFVAAFDALAVYGCAVEEGAIGRAEVLDDEAILRAREPSVSSGDVWVGDDDIVLRGTPDAPRSPTLQRIGFVFQNQLHHLPRKPVPFRLFGGDCGGFLPFPLRP